MRAMQRRYNAYEAAAGGSEIADLGRRERQFIADCAVMPYVALAPEGGVSLAGFPNIRQ